MNAYTKEQLEKAQRDSIQSADGGDYVNLIGLYGAAYRAGLIVDDNEAIRAEEKAKFEAKYDALLQAGELEKMMAKYGSA